ncbi:ABC transporter substrate-binding protein [Achromobacter xylosoxidans]|uniref:ABC transporter substrate-binding protein n=1 Tax=Alcaligenes xylosoxydans xylosoxydans TaxID=85698 RepID=UPI001F12C0F9|nr:ABC transporter substrate-binding protein [Achromobacter xylosoxidans]
MELAVEVRVDRLAFLRPSQGQDDHRLKKIYFFARMTMRTGLKKQLSRAALATSLVGMLGLMISTSSYAETLNVAMQSGLRILDPVVTSSYLTRDHGYMIYDTLLATDSDFKVRPQMADWHVAEDGLTHTFKLRPNLKWHDGLPVRAEDCLASLKRWLDKDPNGEILKPMIVAMEVIDDTTFTIKLNEKTTFLLESLGKVSALPAFMMPKRIAETPASEQIKEYIGSGPFKFVTSEFKPGLRAVYEKNKDYVPRDEPPSWTAGGKVVKVDRVQWIGMPDQMTPINALLNNEIDYIQQVPFDLLPMLEGKDGKDGVKVDVIDSLGSWAYYRFNHLQPPFNNKEVRQAAMYAVGQEDVLKALVGNPKYYRQCVAVFGCRGIYENNYGKEMLIPANPERAQEILKSAGYDGSPVVVLQPTDMALASPSSVVIASALRKAGFKVDLRAMDWQTLITQRANQKPVAEGGWSIFTSYNATVGTFTPMSSVIVSTGKKAFPGWPDVPEVEVLRLQYVKTDDAAERKTIADKLQTLVIDNGVVVPLGEIFIPSAYSTKLTGIVKSPVTVFWNIAKAGK